MVIKMQRFILSDLHMGYANSQYAVMAQAVALIRKIARPGDEVLGLGDWWHMNELGMEKCLAHPMTRTFLDLAGEMPVRLIPGNHDHVLKKYRDNPDMGNPISPINLIKPFWENGVWYCHGDEYDPVAKDLGWITTLLGKLRRRRTPSYLKQTKLSESYLMAVSLVYNGATLDAQRRTLDGECDCRGVILGHTHLPCLVQSPELPWLLDDGDMRHNATFVLASEGSLQLMQWQDGGFVPVQTLKF